MLVVCTETWCHQRIQGGGAGGRGLPKHPTQLFVLQKKQILGQTGHLLRLCKMQKSVQLQGANPPDP